MADFDKTRKWTDRELAQMEAYIRKMYKQAQDEITAEWNAYMSNGQDRLANLYNAYLIAQADQKSAALQAYQDAVQNYTLRNEYYQRMVRNTAIRIANANQIAADYINGKLPSIFVMNFNAASVDALSVGMDFTLRNEYMLRDLFNASVPLRTLNVAKDVAWNERQINSAVLQGILQGESIQSMSKRLVPILNNNANSAVRVARTTVTTAENKGRLAGYDELESEGVVLEKVWIATPDGRVRDWHLSMDGQKVGIHDPFVDGNGAKLMCPGDTSLGAPGNTIWNCRCTMRSQILGVRRKDGTIVYRQTHHKDNAGRTGGYSGHQAQIEAERRRRQDDGE